MDKLKNKRNILLISMVIVALIVVIAILVGNTGDEDIKESKEDIEAIVEETKVSADATEEEKEAVEELQAEYQEKISKAKDSKEAEKLKTEFEKKAQEATGNKVSVPSKPSKPAVQSKPSSSSGFETSTKPNTGAVAKPVVKPEVKPEVKPSSSGSGNTGNTGTTNKPSSGNVSNSGSGSSSAGSTKPSHTHIKEGNMGWVNSPDEIKRKFSAAHDAWWDKVVAGDMKSREPIDYRYRKCSCGKYTGNMVYGNPHTHSVAIGNTGKWFNSQKEAEAYYMAESKKWGVKADKVLDMYNAGEISKEEWQKSEKEYDANCPCRYEIRQCMCGKATLSYWTRTTDTY